MFFLCILGGFVILTAIYLYDQYRPRGYPPGPWGLPILGHLHLLGEQPHETLLQWKKKYGPIFQCDLGSFRGVVLTDHTHIKEALSDPSFSGRPKLRAFTERAGGHSRGIIFTEGREWVEQRRFALRHLRDFGFGKQTQESLIKEEVAELIDTLKKDVDKPISTQNRFNTAVINALWTMFAGVRHSHDDPKLQEIVKLMTDSMMDPSPAALFMPWLTRLAPEWSGWNVFMSDIEPSLKFLEQYVQEHKKTIIENNPRDFIDVYLDEIRNIKDPSSSFYQETGEMSLKVSLLDFFFASNETTSHTIGWAVLYMALPENRHIQNKIQQEMDRVIGNTRLPMLQDRPNLVYFEACLLEIMRYSTVLPLGVWHNTNKDVDFHGYRIPKDTLIVPLLYGTHFDEGVWRDPKVFRPDRFLSSDEQSIVKNDALMPFAIGKRVCIGENLAKDELFLILSALLQTFIVETDPSDPNPSIEPMPGPISSPRPHKIVFRLRNS